MLLILNSVCYHHMSFIIDKMFVLVQRVAMYYPLKKDKKTVNKSMILIEFLKSVTSGDIYCQWVQIKQIISEQ